MLHVTMVIDVPNIESSDFVSWIYKILGNCCNWYNTSHDMVFVVREDTNQEIKDFLKYGSENPPFWFHSFHVDNSIPKWHRYNIAMLAAKNENKGSPALAIIEYPFVPEPGWMYPAIQLLAKYEDASAVGGVFIDKDDSVVNTGWIYEGKYVSPYQNFKRSQIPRKLFEKRKILDQRCVIIKSRHFNGFNDSKIFFEDFCLQKINEHRNLLYTPKFIVKSILDEKIDENRPKNIDVKNYFSGAPIVGIIMPCYNSENFLERTLNGIVAQTYPLWKLFFINDKSTDDSLRIFNKFRHDDLLYLNNKFLTNRLDCRYELHNLNQNLGVSGARNIARDTILYHRPTIEFVAYCDSDDVWLPTHLEESLLEFINYPETDFVYSDVELQFEDGSPAVSFGIPYCVDFNKVELKNANPIYISTVVHRKNCLTVGKFNSEIDGIEDWLYWIKISRKFNIYHLPRTLTIYTVRENSMASKVTDEKRKLFEEEVMKLKFSF